MRFRARPPSRTRHRLPDRALHRRHRRRGPGTAVVAALVLHAPAAMPQAWRLTPGNLYRQKTQTITAGGDPVFHPLFASGLDSTQLGGSVVWTHRLAARTNLAMALDLLRTTSGGDVDDRTRQAIARMTLERRIARRTSGYLTLRWQRGISNVVESWRERAVIVGVTHDFR